MLVNESSFDFALCIICYLSIVLDLSYVLFLDLLAFYSTLVLCFFVCVCFQILLVALAFVPILILQVWVFILGFSFWFLLNFCFLLLFFVYGSYLAFTFCFWFSSGSHVSFLSFSFCLWVKAHYNGPKLMDVVFIINHFHNVKLESLFQNQKHSFLKLKICGFQERPPSKILHIIYILKCNLKLINVWISRIKFNN